MAKSEMTLPAPRMLLNDLLIALSLLTRVPGLRADWTNTDRPAAKAAWAYPLAGAVAVLPAPCLGFAGQAVGVPPSVLALLMLAATLITTGALHEDGLADCSDGFWGGWDPARRLDIMKDSAIGSYGVLALICVFGVKWAALTHWLTQAGNPGILISLAMVSRATMPAVMQALPAARAKGLSARTGQPGWASVLAGIAISAMAALFMMSVGSALLALLLATMTTACIAAIAKRKIGGQTGDVLGATQTVTEAVLFVQIATMISVGQ